MAKATIKKGGKGSRKYGRQERSPSHQRYNNENRRDKNKLKKVQKLVNKFKKPIKVKLGGKIKEINPE